MNKIIKSIIIGWGEGAEWFVVGEDHWDRGWIVGKIERLIDSNYYIEDDKGVRRVEIWGLPHRIEYTEIEG